MHLQEKHEKHLTFIFKSHMTVFGYKKISLLLLENLIKTYFRGWKILKWKKRKFIAQKNVCSLIDTFSLIKHKLPFNSIKISSGCHVSKWKQTPFYLIIKTPAQIQNSSIWRWCFFHFKINPYHIEVIFKWKRG